jgi:hypothetical protein
MTRIELAFPDRQSGPCARWEHGRIELEDLVGLEPTMLSQRIKNPLPWPLGAQVHDWRIRVVSNHVRTG